MSADHAIARDAVERQCAMFAQFVGDNDPAKITRVALSRLSGFPASTLQGWAGGVTMPHYAVLILSQHLPAQAINLLFEPVGKRLVDAESAPADWDGLAARAAGFTAEICEARRDGKIDHIESARLRKSGRALIAETQAIVAGDRMP